MNQKEFIKSRLHGYTQFGEDNKSIERTLGTKLIQNKWTIDNFYANGVLASKDDTKVKFKFNYLDNRWNYKVLSYGNTSKSILSDWIKDLGIAMQQVSKLPE